MGSPASDRASPNRILSPDLDLDSANAKYDRQHPDDVLSGSLSFLSNSRQLSADDSDSEGEDRVMDHTRTLSATSLEPMERLETLQRANGELSRKLMEAERSLQSRLADHESELEDMQSRLEEARSELSATKREEKELRSKERQNFTQITALESEIAKLQKSLDNARASYTSLQKQYQEQCGSSV